MVSSLFSSLRLAMLIAVAVPAAGFAQLVVQPERSAPSGCAVVVEMSSAVVRISANASPTLAAAVLRSLRR